MLDASGAAGELLLTESAITPEAVADAVVAALDSGKILILPHPEVAGYYAARAADPDGWLGVMRHLQAKLDG